MARVLVVHIAQRPRTRRNLEHGLANGRWAFTRDSPALARVVPGDFVLLALGGGGSPRRPPQQWQRGALEQAQLARATSAVYDSKSKFWLDETPRQLLYIRSLDLSYLGNLGPLSLAPGVDLSAAVIEAIRYSGATQIPSLVTTRGSPALSPPRLPKPLGSATAGPAAAGGRQIRFAPLPKQRKAIAVSTLPATTRTIVAREQALVDLYRRHLEAKGHVVGCLQIRDGRHTYTNDLFDKTRQALVEAKGSARRDDIRMAIGQVLDYERGVGVKRRAVLVPTKPGDDLLDLLKRQRIVAIWRDGGGFSDSAGGALS